jgi:acetate kinase
VIRERIGASLSWLGIEIDAAANAASSPRISRATSRVSAWVIPTNEELMIARHTVSILGLTAANGIAGAHVAASGGFEKS